MSEQQEDVTEHDAKVKNDALREAAKICAEYEETFERREANGAAHGAAVCFKAIQALIEGEAKIKPSATKPTPSTPR